MAEAIKRGYAVVVVTPLYPKGVNYPREGAIRYPRKEAVDILRKFSAKGIPSDYAGGPCHCYAEGNRERFTLRDEQDYEAGQINGLDVGEFAAQWGSTSTPGGRALYNLGSKNQRRDAAFWADLMKGIEECRKSLKCEETDADDRFHLNQLEKWATEQAAK